ncbi:MAG: thiol-disulfide oxidoreductase [Melioribacteraceae bacterium]|nr:MAG: thiol-disulfide oxidoreductase [Melioribacteraceae bacterium]
MGDHFINEIIIFDGDCLLCNSFVRVLIGIDKNKRFYFTHPGSNYFAKYLSRHEISDPDKTVYLISGNRLYSKSDAVLLILGKLPVPWKYFKYLRFSPRFLRDMIYDLIARNRKKLFGSKNYCDFMSENERKRILD